MQPYQEKFIENQKKIQAMTEFSPYGAESFDRAFDDALRDMRQVKEIVRDNMALLEESLLPALDDLFSQNEETVAEMEEFADALNKGPKALDNALACQIHEALLSRARRSGSRETVIRLLYKLGMSRHAMWNMLTGVELPEVDSYSMRMRYCFVEAGSYLKYYDEFESEETKSYILRSLANIYLGQYDDWREKLKQVRFTMQVFRDERYRASAPGLPWDSFLFSVNRQMSTVLPYTFTEGTLSADEVADVMEAAHFVYEQQYEKDVQAGKPLLARNLMPYYALSFGCGFSTRQELIRNMEQLMDAADPEDFSNNSGYQIISMAVFYAQYLQKMPELIEPRKDYLTALYRRMLRFIKAMPPEQTDDQMRLYVRQSVSVFIEVEGGVSYRDLTIAMLIRFCPGIYAHGWTVGRMAQAFCEVILDREPAYFDDIPEICALEGREKRAALLELAYYSGLLHDSGKTNFTSLYQNHGRQMLGVEAEMLQLHAEVGWTRLEQYDSTRQYADAARGHHKWYDGHDGYPDSYQRIHSPYRALVDIISFADFLDSEGDSDDSSLPEARSAFDEKIRQAMELSGRRFSPLVTGWLRTPELLAPLEELYKTGRRQGYYHCFQQVDTAAELSETE